MSLLSYGNEKHLQKTMH